MTLPLVSTFDAIPGGGVTELPQATASRDYPEAAFFEGLLGYAPESTSGARVTPMAALGHAPFWQGVNIIAGDIGLLPVCVKRRVIDGQGAARRATWAEEFDHPIDRLLNEQPNSYQTPELFKETLQLWALLYGNGCAAIARDRFGDPEELLPLFPERLYCEKDDAGGPVLIYNLLNGRRIALDPGEVFHIRGLATDGFWGVSAVRVARNVLGLGIAARDHAAATMKNGGRPSGVLETSYESIEDDMRDQLRNEWHVIHGGAAGAGRAAVLTAGTKYVPISMSNTDAQLLELMRLDREQAASLLNLPAHMLNALENAAVRANVAEGNRDYYRRTLARWGGRWGSEAKDKLIAPAERRRTRYWVGVDAESLTGGGPDERMNRAVKGVRGKLITRNEGRELIGENPVDGGDEFENPAIDTNSAGSDEDSSVETREQVEDLQEQVDNLTRRLGAVAEAIGGAAK